MSLALGTLLATTGCGSTEVATVELVEEEQTVAFHLDGPAEVQMWSVVDVATTDVPLDRAVRRFPHIVDYAVSVEGPDGPMFERKCDPFEVKVFKWMSNSEDGRSYEGRMDRCRFAAPAGDYVLHAKRIARSMQDDKYQIESSSMVVRATPRGTPPPERAR